MTHKGPFQPRTFCDSVISCVSKTEFVSECCAGWRISSGMYISFKSENMYLLK